MYVLACSKWRHGPTGEMQSDMQTHLGLRASRPQVRFSQAALDCEMAMLVAESTKDCQVRCLHLDWNKIEVRSPAACSTFLSWATAPAFTVI